jgi:diguanylate cyclase (GGDEF)-like protein
MCPQEGRAPRKRRPPRAPGLFGASGGEGFLPISERLPLSVWCVDGELAVGSLRGGALTAELLELLIAATEAAHRSALRGEPEFFEVEVEARFWRGCVEPLRAGDAISGAVGTALDVTAERRALAALQRSEETLVRQAHYDALTQLPNKQLLQHRLNEALQRARRDGSRVAVLLADLDRFKTINDTLGREVGDLLLRAARDRIVRHLGDADTIARHGGDEFVVVLTGLDSSDEAARSAQTLVDAFDRRFDIEGRDLYSSISVGIGLFPDDGAAVEDILRAADGALSGAKSFGGNGMRFYSAPTHQRAVDRLTLENHLRGAVEREEFRLHYQPVVGAGAAFVGVEALLRWDHPQLGPIPPNEFVPLCEEIGLILPLGRWVVREALAQMCAWAARGVDAGRLALNHSARQFLEPHLALFVAEELGRSGFPAERLELEITESAVMSDLGGAKRAVAEVKALGVGFALDDFGTGYSALSYLKHFPVDALKIDRTFVRDLPADRGDAAIVSAIVALGHALGLRVVAEGVESAPQAALVRRLGCDEQQGYYYARPLPAAELESLLRTRRLGGLRRAASV